MSYSEGEIQVRLTPKVRAVLISLRNYSEVPISFEGLTQVTDHIPNLVINPEDEAYKDLAQKLYVADQTIYPLLIAMAKELYGADHHPIVTRISEIGNCNTNPFKINVMLGKVPKTFFVKNLDPRRYFGKMLMNVLMDGRYTNFKVTEGAVIVDSVPGTVFEDAEESGLVPKIKYLHNLVRLNIFMDAIMLNDVVGNNRNYSVDCSGNIYLLDFDQTFRDGCYYFNGISSEGKKTILAEERAKIKNTIYRESTRIEQILTALESVDLDPELAWTHGFDNIGQLIRQRIYSL